MSRARWIVVVGLVSGLVVSAASTTPVAAAPRVAAVASGRPVGHWTVVQQGPDSFVVSWRAPRRLPVTSDRPSIIRQGQPLGVTVLRKDGRTVEVSVRTSTPPDPAQLDVVLSGDRLDVSGSDVSSGAPVRTRPRHTKLLPTDPADPGAFPVVRSDYQLDPVKLPGMPEPIEMVGHVVEPALDAATGPRPLVLFQHGRHSYCYNPTTGEDGWEWPCRAPYAEIPSQLGYDYVQQVLASQGFATVSVRVNGINAQDFSLDDGGADARAAIVEHHLDHWVGLAAEHHVDLDRVVLVGHSRGGEGVDRAALQIPLSAPYRIAGQVLLAPTDFGTQTAAYVPTVTLLPYCDGDVFDLQGQRFTDTARDLAKDDTSLKSSVLVMGANHNFFNTEWTPGLAEAPAWDDWSGETTALCGTDTPARLTATEQQAVGSAYIAGAVRLFTKDEQQFLPLFDGSATEVASLGDDDIRSHAIGGGRTLRRPSIDTGLSLTAGADTRFCTGALGSASNPSLCGRDGGEGLGGQVPHWPDALEFTPKRPEFEMSWTATGQTGGLVFDDPLDLTGRRLELRTIVDPTVGDARLQVRLTDSTGSTATVTPLGGDLLAALPVGSQLARRWAQSLLVDPTAASGIDLSAITQVDLVTANDHGHLWVLDVASAPATLAGVPAKRLPTIDLGRVAMDEGDGPGTVTAKVPFTITGSVPARAAMVVGIVAEGARSQRLTVPIDLAPGQTSGTIPVPYTADDLDSYDRRFVFLAAFPRFGLMTDQYDGRLVIRDDDPAPTITLRPVAKTVHEGDKATWVVQLSRPVSYDLGVWARVVRGTGPGVRLSVSDVPKSWLNGKYPPTRPLFKTGVGVFQQIRAGDRRTTLVIPILRDGTREGRESVTLATRLLRQRYESTVWVMD